MLTKGRQSRRSCRALIGLLPLLLIAQDPRPAGVPAIYAHAHNDYNHDRPLLDALSHGVGSVEVDVFLADIGEGPNLYVGHDAQDLRPGRTLRSLYLDRLRRRIDAGGGRVYAGRPPLILLVDLKTEAAATYQELYRQLAPYADLLTQARANVTTPGALTVIVSGNRPRELMQAEPHRLAFYDGRPDDIDAKLSPAFMPLVSADWRSLFEWRGGPPMADADRQRLRQYVRRAHEGGYLVRFWAAPDNPTAWEEQLAAGVDLINTDDLLGLSDFLRARLQKPGS